MKDKTEAMKEAEEILGQAINQLQNSQMETGPLVKILERFQQDIEGQNLVTQLMHGTLIPTEVAMLGGLGVLLGIPFTPIVVIPAGLGLGLGAVAHGFYMFKSHNDYLGQRDKIDEHVEGYEAMSGELKELWE